MFFLTNNLTGNVAAQILLTLFTLDRGWKLVCIWRFFRRAEPQAPEAWPRVSLIQPITRGASGLAHNLTARALLNYPGRVQHLLVCDAWDEETQAVCRAWREAWPNLDAQIIPAQAGEPETQGHDTPPHASIAANPASKVAKMQAGAAQAAGDILCFIDDDIAPRPDNLTAFVRHLHVRSAGGVFGLPCYTNWDNIGSSLMSWFVNANALPSYIPLTYVCDPYTLTGHFFGLRRDVFARSGGLDNMEGLLNDDHEIARRVRSLGLRLVQTPAIYDVNNDLPTIAAFHRQIHRWFVFTGRMLWPMTSGYERLVSSLFSLANLFPACLLLLMLRVHSLETLLCLSAALIVAAVMAGVCASRFLSRRPPLHRWPLLLWVILATPWQALLTMLAGSKVGWRGQHIRVFKDGTYEVLP